jgi:hypothetical protein
MRAKAGEETTAHIVLTKYNAVIQGGTGRPGLDPEWLDQRLRLFRDWPVAAMRAQTRSPEAWLVLVDAETPPDHLDRLGAMLHGLGELVPVAGPLTDRRIGEIVGARLVGPWGRLITTRLDSDDAIASSYLQRVASACRGWQGFVNAPLGYRVRGRRVVRCRDNGGPFLSFVEQLRGPAPLTVHQIPHSEAAFRGPLRQLAGGPAWLQVVHGRNLANAFAGWPTTGERAVADMGLEGLRSLQLDGHLPMAERARAGALQIRHELAWYSRAFGTARPVVAKHSP